MSPENWKVSKGSPLGRGSVVWKNTESGDEVLISEEPTRFSDKFEARVRPSGGGEDFLVRRVSREEALERARKFMRLHPKGKSGSSSSGDVLGSVEDSLGLI